MSRNLRVTSRSIYTVCCAISLCLSSMAGELIDYGGTLIPRELVDLYTNNPTPKTTASLRLMIESNSVVLLCRGMNQEDRPVVRVSPGTVGNTLVKISGVHEVRERTYRLPLFEGMMFPRGGAHWIRSFKDLDKGDSFQRVLAPTRLAWEFMTARSRPIWISAPMVSGQFDGWPSADVKTNRTVVPVLAYIPGSTNIGDLAFILWNGTDKHLRIGASANFYAMGPGTAYFQGLNLRELLGTNKVVAPGTVAQWLVPLGAVTNQFAADFLRFVRNAGGDLDIVWGIGPDAWGASSDPLPLFVGERPKSGYELHLSEAASFEKKHAAVRVMTADTKLALSMRLLMAGAEPMLLIKIRNEEPERLFCYSLGVSVVGCRGAMPVGGQVHTREQFGETFLLDPKEDAYLRRSLADEKKYATFFGRPVTGVVMNVCMDVCKQRAGNIWLAFPDANGHLSRIKPFSDTLPAVNAILALSHTGEATSELAFVLWNRTDKEITAVNPFTAKSRVMAVSPKIGYKRDLEMPGVKAKEVTIAPQAHKDWRLPWREAESLIPAEDRAKIKAAGGELDLVWKVGEWESTPLPLLMIDPEEQE